MAPKIAAFKLSPLHEQVVLGSMIRNKETRISLCSHLHVEDFYASKHQTIFGALCELTSLKLDYVPATLKSFLPNEEDWGGVEYLDKLAGMESPENIEFHIQSMRWDVARSKIISEDIGEMEAVLRDPRTGPSDVGKIAQQIQRKVDAVDNRKPVFDGPAAKAMYQAKLCSRSTGHSVRTSGFMQLDKKLTNPFAPGLVTIVAAAPSVGKTTFCLNAGLRQSKKWRVGYLPWESGTTHAIDTLSSCALGIPLEMLIKHPDRIDKEKREEHEEFLSEIFSEKRPFSFLNRPPKDIFNQPNLWSINDRVIDWFESQIDDWGRDIIYWDLFEKRLPDRRPQAISWALDRVQEIADSHKVHIVLLHQITFKVVEERMDKRPTRGMLKGTGGYIEMPDFVFALYREAIYQPGMDDNELELYCLKQRQGKYPFRIIFDWDGQCCRISGGRERQITVINDETSEV